VYLQACGVTINGHDIMRKEGNQVRRKLKSKFVSAVSKTLLAVAMLFAICPCAGKMYEPKLPEKLRKEIGG